MKNRIKEYRKKCELTQQELADVAGCTRQYINMLEADDADYNLSADLLVSLAKALNCTMDDLILTEPSTKRDAA